MRKKTPNPIDIAVGGRVRILRMTRGMSQERLAEHLGITFQQVQKYEKGINRIGASRLQQIATALEVAVSAFFGDATGSAADNIAYFDRLDLKIARASSSLPGHLKAAVLKIIESLTDAAHDAGAGSKAA